MDLLTDNIAVVMILLIAVAMIGVAATFAKNRHNVAPNQVAIISGRGSHEKGYRIVTGGGFFLWPVLERIDFLFLNVMSFSVQVNDVPDKNGVLVDVTGVANVKIQSDAANLHLAIERFLGRQPAEIQAVAKENLEANLRAIVGTMTVEELNTDRNTLQTNVLKEAGTDLGKLGLAVDVLNIQQVTDKKGYIQSLGKARTAEVVRDASIGEANAQRDAAIAKAQADQQAAIAKATSDQQISEANREKDLIVAGNNAQVEAARAKVPLIAATSAAAEQQKLNVAEVEAQKAKVLAETALQTQVGARNKAEQEATTLVRARANAESEVIVAEGRQRAATNEGEALRIKAEKESQGKIALANAVKAEGEATAAAQRASFMAKADGTKAQALAEADGQRAKLLANAEGTKQQLLAEAEGARQKLLAEAEGALKKAEAFKALDEQGRFLMILEASPTAIKAIGEAIGAALQPAAEAIGQGIGAIDELKIVDMGGAKNGSNSVLSQFATLPVETLTEIATKLDAAGFGSVVREAAAKMGLHIPALLDAPKAKPEART
jgi:flotillin